MIGNRWMLLAIIAWASPAQAFIDPPVITPEHPTTQTPIEVAIRNGVCDALLNYTVEIAGKAVNVTITKIPTQDDPLCVNPIGIAVVKLPPLATGPHSLSIYLQDTDPPGVDPVLWFQTTLQIADASGTAPNPIPTLFGWAPFMLILGLLALGVWHRFRWMGTRL